MHICIVTLIKTNNSGSYLQGKTLGMAIEKLGHSVSYYDYSNKGKPKLCEIKKAFGMLLHQGFPEVFKYINSISSFSKLRKVLKINNRVLDVDCFVLGSDTIWNLESNNLQRNFRFFWGEAFKNKKIITYAGSVANAREELFDNNNSRIRKVLSSWSDISVRDEYTKYILSKYTNNRIHFVCDPTLLFSKKDYAAMLKSDLFDNFIFLYLFKDLSDKQNDDLRKFADSNNLKIIRGVNGVNLKVADYSVENSPLVFLNHMMAAKYIVTDTFHGTIFSINLNKQFVTIDRGKNKVNEAINTFSFEDRLVSDGLSFISLLSKEIDYNFRNKPIEDLRNYSWEYLKSTLNEV